MRFLASFTLIIKTVFITFMFTSYSQTEEASVDCSSEGLWGNPHDQTTYLKCLLKHNATFSFRSYSCTEGTCFSEELKVCSSTACISGNGSKASPSNSNGSNSFMHYTNLGEPITASSYHSSHVHLNYSCTGRRYNCNGPGLFADPNDNTIFYKCQWSKKRKKWRAVCFQCNEKFSKCFSNHFQECVPCDSVDSTSIPITEIISPITSYDCIGYMVFPCSRLGYGLHEHPGDRSIAVHCSNETWENGEWMGGCISCPRETISCFVGGVKQCVENCDKRDQRYDCTHFKLMEDEPCFIKGKFPSPFDNTTYFECMEAKDGYGQMKPKCLPCPDHTFFDQYKLQCINPKNGSTVTGRGDISDEDDVITIEVAPGAYDCRPYNELLFPCHSPGFFADPSDTSIYYSCWPLPTGGFAAVCYACNSLHKTCFDEQQGACVTVGNNESCATSTDLITRTDKGNIGSSRTYSCEGYTNESFPCGSHAPGYYAMPGDTSVFILCEDLDGDNLPEFAECHTCDKSTDACFNVNLNKCVNFCRHGNEELTTENRTFPPKPTSRPPITQVYPWRKKKHPYYPVMRPSRLLSYDCRRVSFTCMMPGVFVNPEDPSVWFECSRGRRINDWGFRCKSCPKPTCFDVGMRACVVGCRRISEDRWSEICRHWWSPLCDIFWGLGDTF